MLTEIYIEPLLVDEELADQVGRLGMVERSATSKPSGIGG